MKTRTIKLTLPRALSSVLLVLAALCLWSAPALAQTTSGGTQIQNRASATYSDGTNSYSVVSNTVTVTVANVAGLAITPDGGSIPTVVAGQTGSIGAPPPPPAVGGSGIPTLDRWGLATLIAALLGAAGLARRRLTEPR